MATYVMIGNYIVESMEGISADRTKETQEVVSALGGSVKAMYALLGNNDIMLIVDLPDNDAAIRASVGLTRQTGIAFDTSVAVTVQEFDRLVNGA